MPPHSEELNWASVELRGNKTNELIGSVSGLDLREEDKGGP